MITLPDNCPRECTLCKPLAQITTESGGFICIGHNAPEQREAEQDIFRHCWKNDAVDEMTDWDERDVIDTVSVLMQGLSAHTNMKLNEADQ